ncbi:MFS transporter [Nocardiopsis halophila]|uniref:MFS transporter n=1 Tax=Nocardiopsis halophila TaxID=141692 RepID=UPI000347D976|nr:MFS transporter [Nocardiopsis halophila]
MTPPTSAVPPSPPAAGPGGAAPAWARTGPAIALLAAAAIPMVGQMYSVLALLGPMAEDLGSTPHALTWVSTAFALAYAVGFLFAGPLCARFGPRATITWGLVATAATTALVAAAQSPESAIALRALQGLTTATLAPAAFAYVAEHIRPEHRPAAMTAVSGAALASAPVMQIAAQGITLVAGWQAVFLVSAAALLAAAPVARAVLLPSRNDGRRGLLGAFAAMPGLFFEPRPAALFAATATLLGGFVAVYTAVTVAGPPEIAGDDGALLVLRASALPAMVAVPFLAGVLGRWNAGTRAVAGLALAALSVLATALMGGSTIGLGAVLLVFTAAILVAAPALVQSIGEHAGPERQGVGTALYAFSMFVGAGIGPQLAAGAAGLGFAGIVVVVAGVLLLGALLAAAARRPSA